MHPEHHTTALQIPHRTLTVAVSAPVPAMMQSDPGPGPMIRFTGLLPALLRRWWIPAACVTLAAGAAVAYLAVTPVKYKAAGEIRVDQQPTTLTKDSSLQGSNDFKNLDIMRSLEREVAGPGVLLKVARQFGLASDPGYVPNPKGGAWNDDEIVWHMQRRVSAVLERGTRNIVVTVEDTDPARARDICDAVLKEATQQAGRSGGERASRVKEELQSQSVRVAAEMDAARRKMDEFRSQYPALPLDENASDFRTNTFEDALKSINAKAAETEARRLQLANAVNQIYAANKDPQKLGEISAISQLEEVVESRKALADEMKKWAATDEVYGFRHEKWITGKKELAGRQQSLNQSIINAAVSIVRQHQQAAEDVKRLYAERDRLNGEVNGFRTVAGEFLNRVNEWKRIRAAYDGIQVNLKQAELDAAFTGSVLRIAESPLLPSTPSSPRKKLVLGAAGILGLGAGIGLALLLHLLDRRLRTVADAESALHLPSLTAIPRDARAVNLRSGLIAEGSPPALAEAIRSLRTSLGILSGGAGVRSVLLTAPRSGDGTSYCAMNLAASFAQQGFRTLLIDANLRAPALDIALLGSRQKEGLVSMFTGTADKDSKVCLPTPVQNLFLFCAGECPGHPGEILSEAGFARVLQDASGWFHRIVIDSPACGSFTDALLLARYADTTALVLRAGVSTKEEAIRTAARISQAGGHVAGFILNASEEKASRGTFAGEFAASFRPAPALPALPAPGSRG